MNQLKKSETLNSEKLRSNPDMVVINKNELCPVEIKSVFSKHLRQYEMKYNTLKKYVDYWPEGICIIFNFHEFKVYAQQFNNIEYKLNKDMISIDYKNTFCCISDFFPVVNKEELYRYLQFIKEEFGLSEAVSLQSAFSVTEEN